MPDTSFRWFLAIIVAVVLAIAPTLVLLIVTRLRLVVLTRILRRIVLLPADPEGEGFASLLVRYTILLFMWQLLMRFAGEAIGLLLTLVWVGYQGYRGAIGADNSVSKPSGGPGSLSFRLRTVNGPNVMLGNPFRGVFIAGGAGSGKSKSIIEPLIQQAGAAGLTGVLYDFKFPTLAEEVAGSYAGSSVTPYYVNFTDLSRSNRVNPLAPELLTTASFAREAASTIITNLDPKAAQQRNFWVQSGEVLLAGCIWYLRRNHPEHCTLPAAVSMILENEPAQLLATLQTDEEVRGLIASIASASKSENTIAGVFSTIQNYLAVLNTPEIFWVMSGQQVPFDLNQHETPGLLGVALD